MGLDCKSPPNLYTRSVFRGAEVNTASHDIWLFPYLQNGTQTCDQMEAKAIVNARDYVGATAIKDAVACDSDAMKQSIATNADVNAKDR